MDVKFEHQAVGLSKGECIGLLFVFKYLLSLCLSVALMISGENHLRTRAYCGSYI